MATRAPKPGTVVRMGASSGAPRLLVLRVSKNKARGLQLATLRPQDVNSPAGVLAMVGASAGQKGWDIPVVQTLPVRMLGSATGQRVGRRVAATIHANLQRLSAETKAEIVDSSKAMGKFAYEQLDAVDKQLRAAHQGFSLWKKTRHSERGAGVAAVGMARAAVGAIQAADAAVGRVFDPATGLWGVRHVVQAEQAIGRGIGRAAGAVAGGIGAAAGAVAGGVADVWNMFAGDGIGEVDPFAAPVGAPAPAPVEPPAPPAARRRSSSRRASAALRKTSSRRSTDLENRHAVRPPPRPVKAGWMYKVPSGPFKGATMVVTRVGRDFVRGLVLDGLDRTAIRKAGPEMLVAHLSGGQLEPHDWAIASWIRVPRTSLPAGNYDYIPPSSARDLDAGLRAVSREVGVVLGQMVSQLGSSAERKLTQLDRGLHEHEMRLWAPRDGSRRTGSGKARARGLAAGVFNAIGRGLGFGAKSSSASMHASMDTGASAGARAMPPKPKGGGARAPATQAKGGRAHRAKAGRTPQLAAAAEAAPKKSLRLKARAELKRAVTALLARPTLSDALALHNAVRSAPYMRFALEMVLDRVRQDTDGKFARRFPRFRQLVIDHPDVVNYGRMRLTADATRLIPVAAQGVKFVKAAFRIR